MQYIVLTLFASAMWGSWMQVVKHLKGYPLPAFVLMLYAASFILVGSIAVILQPSMIPNGIVTEIAQNPMLFIVVLVCGALMATGLLISLTFMQRVGMILVTSISSAFSTIFGLIISITVGGLPDNISIVLVLGALLLILTASYICQYSGILRDRDHGKSVKGIGERKYIPYVVLANMLVSCYVLGYSLGTQTPLNPNGFSPLLCVAVLSFGSFVGAMVVCTYRLIKTKEVKKVFDQRYRKQFGFAIISALCHYGGNILNIISTPFLSAPISFLLGKTSDFWTYLWGLLYGEFKGSKTRTYGVLFAGFGVYICGVITLLIGLYLS